MSLPQPRPSVRSNRSNSRIHNPNVSRIASEYPSHNLQNAPPAYAGPPPQYTPPLPPNGVARSQSYVGPHIPTHIAMPPTQGNNVDDSFVFNYKDYPIVIAIDFGTTYSGCSYSFAQNEEIHDITKWPKQNTNIYPKTPTLNYYKKGSTKLADWGNGARLTMLKPVTKAGAGTLMHQYKLYLDDSYQSLNLPPLHEGVTVLDAISDYLRAFHNHILSEIKKGFANNYGQHQIRYCLTVPAIWSDRAKTTMREAAVRAGIINRNDHPDRLMLISEPEAAALYCERKCDAWNLKHGDKFMIVDAGGGTVDLIIYEIVDLQRKRTLKEVTKGHGGSCGSVFLDNNMRRLLAKRFANYMDTMQSCGFESMMDAFVDTIKPEFDGLEEQFLSVPAAAQVDALTDEEIGLEDGIIKFSAQELRKDVFNPVIDQVLELIDTQLNQCPTRVDAIFLVGGFGASNYLYDRVKETFSSRVGLIAVPPRGELAVVRGAVYYGLNPRVVTSKIARRSYGVMTRMTFEEGRDPEESAVVTNDGVKRCSTRFDVFLRKGQRVGIDDRVSKSFWITYPKNTEADLYAYDGDGPIPRQVTDHGVVKIGDFPIEMPVLPGVQHGEHVDMRIDFIFGETEIRIEAAVKDKQFIFTSRFEGVDVFN